MLCSVVIPTRNRSRLLLNTISTLLSVCEAAVIEIECIIISDDSDAESELARNGKLVEFMKRTFHKTQFHHLHVAPCGRRSPGAARNRGLNFLQSQTGASSSLIFLDDDISFCDHKSGDSIIPSQGAELLSAIKAVSPADKTVLGCDYVGRRICRCWSIFKRN